MNFFTLAFVAHSFVLYSHDIQDRSAVDFIHKASSVRSEDLAKEWSGKSTCNKGGAVQSLQMTAKLYPTDSSSFRFVQKIVGLSGSSTVNFSVSGKRIYGRSPNGQLVEGELAQNLTVLRYSGERRSDGMRCVVVMKSR